MSFLYYLISGILFLVILGLIVYTILKPKNMSVTLPIILITLFLWKFFSALGDKQSKLEQERHQEQERIRIENIPPCIKCGHKGDLKTHFIFTEDKYPEPVLVNRKETIKDGNGIKTQEKYYTETVQRLVFVNRYKMCCANCEDIKKEWSQYDRQYVEGYWG